MSKLKRKLLLTAALCSVGTLFQFLPVVPGGCANYLLYEAANAIDFCAIFNCTGGTFFNFCAPYRLLEDCPP